MRKCGSTSAANIGDIHDASLNRRNRPFVHAANFVASSRLETVFFWASDKKRGRSDTAKALALQEMELITLDLDAFCQRQRIARPLFLLHARRYCPREMLIDPEWTKMKQGQRNLHPCLPENPR